jgi:uncharacterized membrane protein
MIIYLVIGAVIYGIYFFVSSRLINGVSCSTVDYGYGRYESCSATGLGTWGIFGSLMSMALMMLVIWIYAYIVQAGVARVGLALTSGQPIEVSTLFNTSKLATIIVAGVIVSVLTAIGTLLCYIPGLAVGFFSGYFVYFIIDKDLSVIDSIKASWTFVFANIGPLILLYLLCAVCIFVGAILCGVGLIVAVPIVIIAQAYAYRKFNNEPIAAI